MIYGGEDGKGGKNFEFGSKEQRGNAGCVSGAERDMPD